MAGTYKFEKGVRKKRRPVGLELWPAKSERKRERKKFERRKEKTKAANSMRRPL